MKNFIVPVDFSAESLNGLKMAILFSKKTKVDIQMIYVLPKATDADQASMEAETHSAETRFKKIIEDYSSLLGNESRLSYLVNRGRIYQEVVNMAELLPDSVISASTHGASGFQELFIGSNAFRIISATDKPVITLRKNSCPESIGRIVLPIDLSVDSRQKVPYTLELAKLFDAEVHVVGIHTMRGFGNKRKVRSYVGQVASYMENKVACVTNEVFGDNTAELLNNYAHTVKAVLISITTERPSGISLIIGNTVHQILNKADIPVLCLTPRNIRKSGTFATTGG
jgi:nucleotide-binding universal stress UspA family protein